jgi:uncharacterized membrane protein YeaQ/YmgE (transglycosylase-associated protein family)
MTALSCRLSRRVHVILSVDCSRTHFRFVASKIVNKSGEGIVMDIVLGIVGAVAGGWLFNTFGHMGVTGVLVAVVGAVIVLFIYHAIVGSHARV